MSGPQRQEAQQKLMSDHEFLESCTDGSLSRIDAISVTTALDASTQSSGLKKAAENGHFNVVRYLLEVEPAIDLDSATANLAAWNGLHMYRLLHARYPNMIHWLFGPEGRMGNAVHTAVRSYDTGLLTYLLDNGGDPGRTPECTRYGDVFTPIEHAALVNNEEASRILVKYGVTFRATEVLVIATQFGLLGLVRCFIELGADINYIRGLEDPYWDTCSNPCTSPLHMAVKCGQVEIVRLFVAHGVDPELRDMSGMTARALASDAGNELILEILENA